MTKPFLNVIPAEEAREITKTFKPLESESVSLESALFRVASRAVEADRDTPGFNRSTMDGYAVRAASTFGATESSPGLLDVVGEVAMGEMPDMTIRKNETVKIWTGGALPEGADAVVMVEHTQELGPSAIEILKAVAPFDNVVRVGEDFRKGETLVPKGKRLRPADLGILAAIGQDRISVHRKPCIAILSSGDEIVPVDQEPPPGCMKDVNRYSLIGMTQEAYADPLWIGIAPDRLKDLQKMLDTALDRADMVAISGGSSMGTRDYVIEALEARNDSEVLIHGVSISPGKPLIMARVGKIPVVGLPGHPVSAMVCFDQFVVPLLRRLEGEDVVQPYGKRTVSAVLSRNVPSREGREDFVRVRIEDKSGTLTAVPVRAKSGMISSMVRAHGHLQISSDCEGLYRGDRVTVHLFSNWTEENLETAYLSGHEASGQGAGDVFATPRQERLSRV
jgi:molybdopterin molybdotransferase